MFVAFEKNFNRCSQTHTYYEKQLIRNSELWLHIISKDTFSTVSEELGKFFQIFDGKNILICNFKTIVFHITIERSTFQDMITGPAPPGGGGVVMAPTFAKQVVIMLQ